jgi:hypothetical protein
MAPVHTIDGEIITPSEYYRLVFMQTGQMTTSNTHQRPQSHLFQSPFQKKTYPNPKLKIPSAAAYLCRISFLISEGWK